jgi:hypothetical protein
VIGELHHAGPLLNFDNAVNHAHELMEDLKKKTQLEMLFF